MPMGSMVSVGGCDPCDELPGSLAQFPHRGFSDTAEVEVSLSILTNWIRTEGKPIKEAAGRSVVNHVVGVQASHAAILRPQHPAHAGTVLVRSVRYVAN